MLRAALFVLCILVVSCARKDETSDIAHSDTLLQTPATPDTHSHSTSLENGLLIDSSRLMPAEREKALARFTPKQILAVYRAYRPLRRTDISQSSVDSFLRVQRINMNELHAILEEGDRLGWSTKAK